MRTIDLPRVKTSFTAAQRSALSGSGDRRCRLRRPLRSADGDDDVRPRDRESRVWDRFDNVYGHQSRLERRGDLCRRRGYRLHKTSGAGQAAEHRPRRGPARVAQCRHERRSARVGKRYGPAGDQRRMSRGEVSPATRRRCRDRPLMPLGSMRCLRRRRARFPRTF